MATVQGILQKMTPQYQDESGNVEYQLVLDGEPVLAMHELVGYDVSIQFNHLMSCVHCGQKVNKLYNDGHCFPCTQRLAQCDICIVKPERCHYHLGTCRDDQFAQTQCFQPHILYLARSDVIKVGITREKRLLSRWMDQGAVEAVAIGRFDHRLAVGQAEVAVAAHLKDKANWRKMLKNDINRDPFDFYRQVAYNALDAEQRSFILPEEPSYAFHYPVESYPNKVQSLKLDKILHISERLSGIKGQYLMFGDLVMNVRAHSGYLVTVEY